MAKLFGIIVIVVGLWAGVEIYNEGTANAFDGALARMGMVEAAEPGEEQHLGQRAGSKVRKSQAEAEARRSRMLGE
ncbi:MAG: hypothetical protein JRG80_18720 [Deltaproteobacteria bacterium]|nr:hypothetical protein [Deltaproteobacteria bacterium]MBW2401260.1 hypothetical protein [Deltaproteobacteria bacterium]